MNRILMTGLATLVCQLTLACGDEVKDDGKGTPDAAASAGGAVAGAGGETGTGGASAGGATVGAGGATVGAGGAQVGAGGAAAGGAAVGGAAAGGASPDGGPPVEAGVEAGPPNSCAGDGDCAPPYRFCDVANSVCVECLSTNHCTGGKSCDVADHTCKFTCTNSGDCKDPRPYCDQAKGECVECLGNANCTTPFQGDTCDPGTGTCGECVVHDDCPVCILPLSIRCCSAGPDKTCSCRLTNACP